MCMKVSHLSHSISSDILLHLWYTDVREAQMASSRWPASVESFNVQSQRNLTEYLTAEEYLPKAETVVVKELKGLEDKVIQSLRRKQLVDLSTGISFPSIAAVRVSEQVTYVALENGCVFSHHGPSGWKKFCGHPSRGSFKRKREHDMHGNAFYHGKLFRQENSDLINT